MAKQENKSENYQVIYEKGYRHYTHVKLDSLDIPAVKNDKK